MSRRRRAAVMAALAATGLVGAQMLPSAAQQPPPPIAAEMLTGRAVFTDHVSLKVSITRDDEDTVVARARNASRTVVGRFTLQPGAQFPWHSHRGPVIVNVTQGELTYLDADTCTERAYAAGTAFVDPGRGHVHTAFNDTKGVTVIVATFYAAPAEGSLLIPAETPDDCPDTD